MKEAKKKGEGIELRGEIIRTDAMTYSFDRVHQTWIKRNQA